MVTRAVFDADHDDFRRSVRQLVEAEVVPHLDAWREDGVLPHDVLRAAGEQGFLGIVVPEELGGGGIDDPRFTAVLVEEVAAVGALGLALAIALHSGVALPFVLAHRDDSVSDAVVSELAAGSRIAAVAVAPVGDGSDAEVAGVVSGSTADVLVLGSEDGVVVSGDGVTIKRSPVDDALGARESGLADLVLTGPVEVLAGGNLLAELRQSLDLWAGVVAVASARASLDLTVEYVNARKVFGRPLAELENTRHVLASVGARLDVAQLAVDAALEAAVDGSLSARQAAVARTAAVDVCLMAADEGMQLHGGYGYMREYPIAHAFADARALQLVAATFSDAREPVAVALGL